jgi:elongation factor Ts
LQVTTEQVKALRERTGAGIMDCRRALVDASGDMDRAAEMLRERGIERAEKKAGREARQGLVESYIHAGGRVGALVELNCETDFVARNPQFRELAHEIAMQVAAMNPARVGDEPTNGDGADQEAGDALLTQAYIRDSSKTIRDLIKQGIAGFGENIVVRRFVRFELGGEA